FTRMARSRGSARMLRSSLAPSVRLPESSAKRSKNLVSRGIRRMYESQPGSWLIKKMVKVRSRVLSHAGSGAGKRCSALASCSAGDQRRGAAGGLEPDDKKQGENRGWANGD